jgi:hypothetical protein
LPSLTAAGVVGAAFSMIHARLVQRGSESPLIELVNPVMAMVVLPYRGRDASLRELERPVPELPVFAGASGDRLPGARERRTTLTIRPVRVTERTCSVLASVSERPGANSRQVAAGAGVDNEPQISRLLARLQEHGLVENRGGGPGLPKSWWLTASGAEFLGKDRSLIDTYLVAERTQAQREEQAA